MEIFHWSILLFFKKTSSHIFSNSFFLSGGSDPYLLPAHVIFSIDCFRQGLKLQQLSLTLCTGELRPLTTKSSSPRSQLQKTGGMTMLHLRKQLDIAAICFAWAYPDFLALYCFFTDDKLRQPLWYPGPGIWPAAAAPRRHGRQLRGQVLHY